MNDAGSSSSNTAVVGAGTDSNHVLDAETKRRRQMMREETLKMWIRLGNMKPAQSATFHMHDRTSVKGDWVAIDPTESIINVANLKTPLGTYPQVSLRNSDMRYIVLEGFYSSATTLENSTP